MNTEASQKQAHWGDPDSVFGRLRGTWRLERRVDRQARMTGTAVITWREDGHLSYLESGRLRLDDGQEFDSQRQYLFERCPAGFTVLFPEQPPRPFHRIILYEANGVLHGGAIHVCGNDRYESRYEFLSEGSFVIRHAVIGPRKDYTMTTRYSPLGDPPV